MRNGLWGSAHPIRARIPGLRGESRRWNARLLPYEARLTFTALSRLVRLVRMPDFAVNGISTYPDPKIHELSVGRHLIRLTVPMFLGIS